MDHPPYSPNLAPIDFHFFVLQKKHLAGKWSATDSDVKQAVTSWLQTRDTDSFYARIQALVP
jgi:hypothetical protein